MFKLEAQIFLTSVMEYLTSSKMGFLPFFPSSEFDTNSNKVNGSFYHQGFIREQNCLKAKNWFKSYFGCWVFLLYSCLLCCLYLLSLLEQFPEQTICHIGLPSSLNWQNVLHLYFCHLIFPEHIDVSTYMKAKQAWKKCFVLGAAVEHFVVHFT